jgi:hypothetical protein
MVNSLGRAIAAPARWSCQLARLCRAAVVMHISAAVVALAVVPVIGIAVSVESFTCMLPTTHPRWQTMCVALERL